MAGLLMVLGTSADSAVAAQAPAMACPATGNVIFAAKMPEIDLYDGNEPSESAAFLKTLKRSEFPGCLDIIQQAPNSMLKVMLGKDPVWIPPNMVDYRFDVGMKPKKICASWSASSSEEEKVGSTRALGNGCGGAEKQKQKK
jgi:hypothetical protein